MNAQKYRLFILALLCIGNLASAQTAYVSDRLYLGLYALPDISSDPIKTMTSGTQVEVIQRQGDFVFITLADGSQGWARAEFISEQVPAVVQMQQLTAERDRLQAQLKAGNADAQRLATLQNQLIQANKTIGKLKTQLKEEQAGAAAREEAQQLAEQEQATKLESELSESRQKITDLQARVEFQQQQLDKYSDGNQVLKIIWLLLTALISIGIGAVLGARWLAVRIRRRFNGLKVW